MLVQSNAILRDPAMVKQLSRRTDELPIMYFFLVKGLHGLQLTIPRKRVGVKGGSRTRLELSMPNA